MRFSLAAAFVALAAPALVVPAVAEPTAPEINSGRVPLNAAVAAPSKRQARVDANGNHAGGAYESLVARHAAANGVPVSLVHRVIMRESRYNPRAVSSGNYGIMQIRLGTARALGYSGSAQGLLDADTNMTYAVKYLAGAYKVAGGNHDRAVGLYARGYYYDAKRKGLNAYAMSEVTPLTPVVDAIVAPAATPAAVERASESNQDLSKQVLEDKLAPR
jgi:soluble lytic murein transglycosylase-like protein